MKPGRVLHIVNGAVTMISEQSFFAASFLCCRRVVRILATGSFSWHCVFVGKAGGKAGARADAATAVIARDGIGGFCGAC